MSLQTQTSFTEASEHIISTISGKNTCFYKTAESQVFKLTPSSAKGPLNIASWATRHLSRFAKVSKVLWPPRKVFPSANIASSSGVAPPVTNVRIKVSALLLK